MTTHSQSTSPRFQLPLWLGFLLFAAVALFFLWEEHQAHIRGALPYLLLLACPLIHLFMHRGHGGHEHHREPPPHGSTPGSEYRGEVR